MLELELLEDELELLEDELELLELDAVAPPLPPAPPPPPVPGLVSEPPHPTPSAWTSEETSATVTT